MREYGALEKLCLTGQNGNMPQFMAIILLWIEENIWTDEK
jgi:hypothetical protein